MSAAKKLNPESVRGLRESEKKWTKPVLDAGWTLIPSVMLERQRALGLDAVDMNILLHIVRRWWHAEKLPYPSKGSIAECMNMSASTVRRRIKRMEADGLLKRKKRSTDQQGQKSNFYELTGLIEALGPYAEEAIKTRAKRKREDRDTRIRKGFRLVK